MQIRASIPTALDFEAIFSATESAYLILDAALIIVGVNDAYLRATVRSRESVIGRHVFDAFPANPSDLASSGVNTLHESFTRVLQNRTADRIEMFRYDIPTGPGKDDPFEERYWGPINTPVFDGEGTLTHIIHQAVDITKEVASENALRESELRYRALTNATGDMIYRMSPDWTHMHELDGRDFLKDTKSLSEFWIEDYILPEDRELVRNAINHAIRNKSTFELEHRVLRVDRSHGWTHSKVVPILDADGEIREWIGSASDITARKFAEEQLQHYVTRQSFELELSDRLRSLNTLDEITVAISEMLGHRLNASRAFYAEVDSSQSTFFIRQHWKSKGMTSIAGEVRRLDDFGPDIIAALRAGETVVADDIALDARAASYAEAYAKIGVGSHVAMPLLNSGRLIAILAVHSAAARHWTEQDIEVMQYTLARTWAAVESGRAQLELQIQHDRSQSVFDSMAEGFALLDSNWTLIEVNEVGSRLAKVPRLNLIGRNQWEAMPELVGTPVEALYKRVQASAQHESIEHCHSFPDGATGWLEIRVFPIKYGQLAIFFRDITNRKQIEQELHEVSRRKDEFLAMLAHELRNPLAPIAAAATLLEIAALDEVRVRQTSEIINRQVSHMTSLIDDLLDVSRVTRGLVTLDNSELDIGHIIADAVEQVTPLIRAKHHYLSVHLSPEMVMVRGDRKRLVQVLANILNNSAKYTPEGGNIELRTRAPHSQVVIEVTDNGIGMASDLVARAFDLFAQAERTSDRSAGGLGLGLALVKSLTELHGGTVSCASDGVGKGTVFTIYLPRLLDPKLQSEQHDRGSNTLKTLSPLRIMIVDDNVDAASMLQMVLEVMGHTVTVEHGSRRALERAQSETPDVCLLDIGLPDMDGIELAQRLRALPNTAKSVLIAITGYGQESDRQRTFAAGFDHHLVKPLDAKELVAILAEIHRP